MQKLVFLKYFASLGYLTLKTSLDNTLNPRYTTFFNAPAPLKKIVSIEKAVCPNTLCCM